MDEDSHDGYDRCNLVCPHELLVNHTPGNVCEPRHAIIVNPIFTLNKSWPHLKLHSKLRYNEFAFYNWKTHFFLSFTVFKMISVNSTFPQCSLHQLATAKLYCSITNNSSHINTFGCHWILRFTPGNHFWLNTVCETHCNLPPRSHCLIIFVPDSAFALCTQRESKRCSPDTVAVVGVSVSIPHTSIVDHQSRVVMIPAIVWNRFSLAIQKGRPSHELSHILI
jgi:hypothetical protein